jgi:predicted MFS family arabinose efflux permease
MAFAAGGYAVWLIDFLERDKLMSKQAATNLLMAAFGGAVAGIVTGGRLADWLRTRVKAGRLWIIAAGMVLSLPCVIVCLEIAPGAPLFVAGIATLFFMSWYHAPIAVSVDDLAPPAHAVAAQGLVIATMHLFGTAPSAWLLGVISDHSSLYTAMWVPTAFIAIAAVAMVMATRTFAADARAARGGGEPAASL